MNCAPCTTFVNGSADTCKCMGAAILTIDDSGDDIPADYVVAIHSGLNSLERGPLLLLVLQLLAYYRSMKKGLNPDRPKNLDAVVVL